MDVQLAALREEAGASGQRQHARHSEILRNAMSQENVEIVRSMYRPGDPSRFFELLHEGVQVDISKAPLLPDQPELIGGKEAALDFYRHYWGTWDEYVLEPADIIDAGDDRVVVVHASEGAGREAGRRLSAVGPSSTRCGRPRSCASSSSSSPAKPSKPPGFGVGP